MVPQHDSEDQSSIAIDRRTAIAGLGAGTVMAISGCSAATNRSVGDPEVNEEDGSTIHNYYASGDRVTEVSLSELSSAEVHQWRYPIRLNVWHGDGLRLESLTYTFHPNSHVELYLKRPDGYPWEAITFSRGDDAGTTVLKVPDLGFQGRGSVTFELLLAVFDDDPFSLRVEYEASIDDDRFLGRGYELEDEIEQTMPGQAALESE